MSMEGPNENPDEFEGLTPEERHRLVEWRRMMVSANSPAEHIREVLETERLTILMAHEIDWLQQSDYAIYTQIAHTIREDYQNNVFDTLTKDPASEFFGEHFDSRESLDSSNTLARAMIVNGTSQMRERIAVQLKDKPSAEKVMKILEDLRRLKHD